MFYHQGDLMPVVPVAASASAENYSLGLGTSHNGYYSTTYNRAFIVTTVLT
jgi:hypothetical protein